MHVCFRSIYVFMILVYNVIVIFKVPGGTIGLKTYQSPFPDMKEL